MIFELLLLLLALLLYLIIKDRKPSNMPPGPFEIPFLGTRFMTTVNEFMDGKKCYGNITCGRMGAMRAITLYDYKDAKEAMARMEFSTRPGFIFFTDFSLDDKKTGGLLGSNGVQWQHDRRFALRNLRNLGMGKSYLEEAINTEAKALVEDLKLYKGEPIKFPDSFRTVALNIIWQMVASRRYDLRSKEVNAIYDASKEFQNLPVLVFLPLFFPALNYLPKFLRDILFKEYVIKRLFATIGEMVDRTINEHEKDVDLDNPRDLIDEYFKAMKEEEGNEELLFRRGALCQIIADLFGACSDTINNMLKWIAFLLARYPQITEKLQQEIDDVVPRDQMVSINHKPILPYVEAFTVEVLRYSSMVFQNVHRTAVRDTSIAGYFVPKDTVITAFNYAIHHDPKYWSDPHTFSPERFLDQDGKFQAPKEGFFAFGSGRRQCLGENLARMELFLFTAAIVQNFNIKVPDGVTLVDKWEERMTFRLPADTPLVYHSRS